MTDDYIAEGVEPVTIQDMEDEVNPPHTVLRDGDEHLPAESTTFFTRIYSARYPLSAVFGWLCWLMVALLLIDTLITGLHSIHLAEYRRLTNETVCNDYQAPIDIKRDELLSMTLHKRLFETHPQCLARAITIAHRHYDDIPYQSVKELVNETISWAQGECNKLMFTPEAPPTGWYWVWRAIADNTETAFRQCGDAFGNIYKRFFFSEKKERKASRVPELAPLILPSGYRIRCVGKDYSVCELSCTADSSLQIGESLRPCNGTSNGTSSAKMHQYMRALNHLHAEIGQMKKLLPWLNCGAFIISLVVIWDIIHMEHVAEGWKLLRILATCFLVEIPFLQAHFWHQRVAEIDRFPADMTTSTFRLHILIAIATVVLLLIQWNSRSYVLPDPWSIWHELCAIYLGKTHGVTHQSNNEQTDNVQNNNDTVDGEAEGDISGGRVPEAGGVAFDVSTSPIHRITPKTPFHEDVQNMREQLRWEQATSKLGLHPSLLQGAPQADSSAVGPFQDSEAEAGWTVVSEGGGGAASSTESASSTNSTSSTDSGASLDDMESF